jgi:hypothetical protein
MPAGGGGVVVSPLGAVPPSGEAAGVLGVVGWPELEPPHATRETANSAPKMKAIVFFMIALPIE